MYAFIADRFNLYPSCGDRFVSIAGASKLYKLYRRRTDVQAEQVAEFQS
jgi:hypothetical protein